jgi:hypothetical protein
MKMLLTVAVASAWLVGDGAEGAAVVFLFALSELFESSSFTSLLHQHSLREPGCCVV